MAHVKGHAKQKKSSKNKDAFREEVGKIMSKNYHYIRKTADVLWDKVGKAGGGTVYRKRNYAYGGRVAKYKK